MGLREKALGLRAAHHTETIFAIATGSGIFPQPVNLRPF
jgi:hypothetical protein